MKQCELCGKKTTGDKYCKECYLTKKNHFFGKSYRPMLGKKHTKATKERMRIIKLAENNPNWIGDRVGYMGLHDWVRTRKIKPELCEYCSKAPPLDLANKGTYDRNLGNWEYLCRRCHMLKDGRLKNIGRIHDS